MAEGRRIFLSKLQLDMQTGVGLSTGQGSDPVVMFRFSKNSGYTWSNETQMDVGRIGEYSHRVMAWRLGEARNFVFEFSYTDPTVLALLDLYLEGEEGSN